MENVFTEERNCSGCTACLNSCPNNAISMKENEQGFLYPYIDKNKCTNCKLCTKVCPFKKEWFENNKNEIPKVYALKNKDENIRDNSTSGGAFSILAEYVIKENGIVYGALLDENNIVKHVRIDELKNIQQLRGSKYVQSFLGNIFKDVKNDLEKGKKVMFVGTPCQVAGLKTFLQKDFSNLILVDFICHGVPSPMMFKEHINYLERRYNKKVKNYNFRSKIRGWHKHTEKVEYSDKSFDYKSDVSQAYKHLFCEHSIMRLSCCNCKFTEINRISDFTLGDYWGIEEVNKKFDDNKGVSLFLVNTYKANNIFEKVKEKCTYIQTDYQDCMRKNHFKPIKNSPVREKFWNDYYNFGYEYLIKKYSCCGLKMKIFIALKSMAPYRLRIFLKKILKRV